MDSYSLRDFFFHIQPRRDSDPFLDRIRLIVLYVILVLSVSAGTANLMMILSVKNYYAIAAIAVYMFTIILAVIFFWITHDFKITQRIASFGLLFLMTEIIFDAGGYYGIGTIYFVAAFSIVYLLMSFKLGLFMPVYYFIGLYIKLTWGSIKSESIFYNPIIKDRFLLVLGVACILGITASICLKLFINHISKLAFEDALTKTPNQNKLNEYIFNMTQVTHTQQKGFAVVGIKIYNLHKINSNLGTKSGDQVIQKVANRLQKNLSAKDIAGRWSSSLFVILLNISEYKALHKQCKKLLAELSEPYMLLNGKVFGQFTMAISRFPIDSLKSNHLLENINNLLDQNYNLPGDILYFNEEKLKIEKERFKIIEAMNHANLDQEFSLKYQPKIKLEDNTYIGAEILLRWKSPKLGKISPAKFIPLAEESGFIKTLTRWIIIKAFNQISQIYKSSVKKKSEGTFAINLSVVDLKDEEFVIFVKKQLNNTDLLPSVIEFELTEGILVDDDPTIQNNLKELNELGFKIAIDDFGTGYSSLSYLHKMNVHNLKIDQSFIRLISENNEDKSFPIVDGIISMGNSLGLEITAEGIETEDQELYLKERGCGVAQGWLYSKAISFTDYIKFIKK